MFQKSSESFLNRFIVECVKLEVFTDHYLNIQFDQRSSKLDDQDLEERRPPLFLSFLFFCLFVCVFCLYSLLFIPFILHFVLFSFILCPLSLLFRLSILLYPCSQCFFILSLSMFISLSVLSWPRAINTIVLFEPYIFSAIYISRHDKTTSQITTTHKKIRLKKGRIFKT